MIFAFRLFLCAILQLISEFALWLLSSCISSPDQLQKGLSQILSCEVVDDRIQHERNRGIEEDGDPQQDSRNRVTAGVHIILCVAD